MKYYIIIFLSILSLLCNGQSIDKLILRGNFSKNDSIEITRAYLNANQAVIKMYNAMNIIWDVEPNGNQSLHSLRKEKWDNDSIFTKWLGHSEKIRMAKKRIHRIYSKYDKNMYLKVTKENKGRCKGWISAWTVPYGRVKVRICEDYLKYRTYLHEKTLIHELGHEAGMPFHRRIHGCWKAQRAAELDHSNVAKRSPENYAWLAMSFLGLECSH